MTTELSHCESIKYLRDSAIRAHLDGQGAKARQLAAIALRKEANKGVIPVVNLEDLAWAFYLVIYWMLEEEDFSIVLDGAWESFNKKPQTSNTGNNDAWHTIIQFFIDVLMPNGEKWEADIKALEEIPKSFFAAKNDQYANEILCMILPLVIDFVHYLYPDKKEGFSNVLMWHSFCKRWESHALYAKNEDLQKMIMTTRERTEKQHTCLFEPGAFPYKAENALEEFWNAFYSIDVDEMKRLLPRLTKLAQEDEDRLYPVQSLINMTRFIVRLDTDQFPGVYRIQRLYMENQQWLFGRLRNQEFSLVLNDAFSDAEHGKPIGSKSVQLWRLPLISEINALRNWDLRNYLESLNTQSKASIFLGLFSIDYKDKPIVACRADDLRNGIFNAVKGWSLQNEKTRHFNDVKRAIYSLELMKDAKSEIESLIKSLLKSRRPIETRGLVNFFSVVSDAIPLNCLEDVFKIAIVVFSEKEAFWGFDMKMLNWWEDIFKWNDLDRKKWDIVDILLTDLFHNPFFWNISNAMLKEALIKAPKDLAHKWANTIAINRNKNDLYPYGYSIVYNASLERSDLREYAFLILDFLEKDPALAAQMMYDRALLLSVDEDNSAVSNTLEGSKLREAYVVKYLQYAQSVANRRAKPQIRIGMLDLQTHLFRRMNWGNLSKKELARIDKAIKAAIGNSYCSERDFITLLPIWSIITSQQDKNVIDEAGIWLIDLCRNYQPMPEHLPGIDSPFSRMSIVSDVKDATRFVKTAALSRFLHRVSLSICKDMFSWIQDEIPETEEAILPILWEMLLALYITGTNDQSISVLNALNAIYARTATDTLVLKEVAERSYNVMIMPQRKKGKRLMEILKDKKDKDINSILNMLDKIIGKLVQAPNSDGRRAAALLLKLFGEMGWINDQRDNWTENLKKDPRARVFSVFRV
ncbi:MAG: hypothetical protein NT178_18385 [Proteobacteria bacterium]|nr:hypothetical protein [Pseudomonadota bacterium]